ncbi:hypothetical protein [Ruegeria sp. EL01]|jgi:Fe2+ transport system protein B|uniref:hypothetical protein n=1 Tax=Ruegeria sp. EL01 TaxID=2107578 RepID=UPI000EA825DF|nr:hypothetical protein [Ruegeria sp. EL01]
MLRAFLYLLGGIFLLGPIIIWALMSSMSCAYVTAAQTCSIRWSSFLNPEFYTLSAVPWLIGVVCVVGAIRLKPSPDLKDEGREG